MPLVSFLINLVVQSLLRLYRWVISPIIHLLAGPGFGCRFQPSCSHYAEEALLTHGALRGTWLALRRLLRCQPFGSSGYDPVPPLVRSTESCGIRASTNYVKKGN